MVDEAQPSPTREVEANIIVAALGWIASSNLRVVAVHGSLALAAYAVVLNGPLFFDDKQFIEWNQHVTNLDLAEIYTSRRVGSTMSIQASICGRTRGMR